MEEIKSADKLLLPFVLAAAGLIGVYSPAFYYLFDAWMLDPYYSHGFLVPVVSAYIAWQNKKTLIEIARPRDTHTISLFATGIILYMISIFLDFRFMMYFSFLVSLAGFTLYLWGPEVLREVRFPIAYMLLMIPLPFSVTSAIAFPLQLMSSKYSALILDLFRISALQDGVNLFIPGFSFIIEKGCSGLNSTVSLFTLSVLFAYMVEAPIRRKAFIVFSSVPIALTANISRIVAVILVAHFFGKEAAESFFHTFSSVFLFAISLLLLILTAGLAGCLKIRKF